MGFLLGVAVILGAIYASTFVVPKHGHRINIPVPPPHMKHDPRIFAPGGIRLKPWEKYA